MVGGQRGAVRTMAGVTAAAGSAVLAYGALYERTAYTLRRVAVPGLPAGARPLRLLHLSDLHVTVRQRGKLAWLADLARVVPDLVTLTGDILCADDARGPLLTALEPLASFPGVFVPGNNDYSAPTLRSPHRYLRAHVRADPRGEPLDWPGLAKELTAGLGWTELTNTRGVIAAGGLRIDLRGVDDAHLGRDRAELVAGPPQAGTDLAIGLSHTPEPRVLDAFAADGVGLVLSGHTHGGQIRLPGIGALVGNCGLERSRLRGLSRHETASGSCWLHVSPGLGTSPFAPVRLGCRPEATLLTLLPAGP
ncbi:putative phosphohydrolase [Frankia canadensis]|uniref:Putative phosphohydrolase n=1 Tax=Frankia canadensis TaxID=1836972 RepID=A0A2I2KY95_9ACTN|nr:putative phosphohydrolase [Frankia canadensis]SOU57923.1 putative phosphohydrolase [Frankia canadensis]